MKQIIFRVEQSEQIGERHLHRTHTCPPAPLFFGDYPGTARSQIPQHGAAAGSGIAGQGKCSGGRCQGVQVCSFGRTKLYIGVPFSAWKRSVTHPVEGVCS